MNASVHDDLEAGLRDLFERQAGAMRVSERTFDDPPLAAVTEIAPARRPRALLAVLATAAAVLLVVGIVAVIPNRNGVFVAGQAGTPAPLQFATRQVSFAADGMVIDAGGQKYTAGGSIVDVNSDPGTHDKYTTLELIWNERGVEMRLFAYFTSDGHNWWANEVRTYNGKAAGDWIEYNGKFFSAPLGQSFTGDVDLTADDGGGHVHFSNLRLRAFLPPPECKNATAKYALDPSYERVDLPAGADGFGLGTTGLLDTASCTVVADPHAYAYDWQVADPSVVKFDTYDGSKNVLHAKLDGLDPSASVDVSRTGVGSTTLHLTARVRATGKVVATADIPVVVK